jgi:hypothetical protein
LVRAQQYGSPYWSVWSEEYVVLFLEILVYPEPDSVVVVVVDVVVVVGARVVEVVEVIVV